MEHSRHSRPRINVRRIDQAYRLVVTLEDLEHTHYHPFPSRDEAWHFGRTVCRPMLA